jgi:hypothetical protein
VNGRRVGFTLVEMLLATVLAAIMMGGVLTAASTVARDRRRMEARQAVGHEQGLAELVRRDLANGLAIVGPVTPEGFELVGHGGIDPRTMVANQRLCRVAYRVVRRGGGRAGVLVREQAYLDDPIRRDPWREVVAVGVTRVGLTSLAAEGEPVRVSEEVVERLRSLRGGVAEVGAVRVPARVRLRVEFGEGVVDRELVLR